MTSDVFSDCLLLFRSLQITSDSFRRIQMASTSFKWLHETFQMVPDDFIRLFRWITAFQTTSEAADFRCFHRLQMRLNIHYNLLSSDST